MNSTVKGLRVLKKCCNLATLGKDLWLRGKSKIEALPSCHLLLLLNPLAWTKRFFEPGTTSSPSPRKLFSDPLEIMNDLGIIRHHPILILLISPCRSDAVP